MIHKQSVAARVGRTLLARGLRFASAFDLDPGLHGTWRDLDMIFGRGAIERAATHIGDELLESGFFVMKKNTFSGYIWMCADDGAGQIEFDLADVYRWGLATLIEGPAPDRDPKKADPWVSLAKRNLIYLLSRRRPKDWDPEWVKDSEVVRNLRRLFGSGLGESVRSAYESGRAADMPVSAMRLRLLTGYAASRPAETVRNLIRWIRMEMSPWISDLSPSLCLMGPDGTGKSSLARLMAEDPDRAFNVVVRHLRPEVLPDLGILLRTRSKPDTAAPVVPRTTPGNWQWIRSLYYAADWVAGHLLKDRAASGLCNTVVYDRCFLDMAADPFRYRLASDRGILRLWRRMPKTDICALVLLSPAEILRRKAELTEGQLNERFDRLTRLYREGYLNAVIRPVSPLESNRETLRHLTTIAFALRHARRSYTGSRDLAFRRMAREAGLKVEGGGVRLKERARLWRGAGGRCFLSLGVANEGANIFRTLFGSRWNRRIPNALKSASAFLLAEDVSVSPDDGAAALEEAVRRVAGPRIRFGYYLGTAGPRQKTVLLGYERGTLRAGAKIGWNDETRAAVEREAAALQALSGLFGASGPFSRRHEVVESGARKAVLFDAVPVTRSGDTRVLEIETVGWLTRSADRTLSVLPLARSEFWQRLLRDTAGQKNAYYRSVLEAAADEACRWSHEETAFGLMHGDFAPWNVGFGPAGMSVFDWEFWEPEAPVLLDAVHYLFQSGLLIHGRRGPGLLGFVHEGLGRSPGLRQWMSSRGYADEERLRRILILYFMRRISGFGGNGFGGHPEIFECSRLLNHLLLPSSAGVK